jgi:CRISPR-associated protein Cmr1
MSTPPFAVLTLEYRLNTPLFLGGAEPNEPEIRAPSLRGALHKWYRAADPEFHGHEFGLFGNAGRDGSSQGRVTVRLDPLRGARETPEFRKASFSRFTQRVGRYDRNGVTYLGFPFDMGANLRRYIVPTPSTRLIARLVIHRPMKLDDAKATRDRRGLLAAAWLLGRLGGLGARTRRGFGSLDLVGWQISAEAPDRALWLADMGELPFVGDATPQRWFQDFANGRHRLRTKWFPGAPPTGDAVPHIGDGFKAVMLTRGHEGDQGWQSALNEAGRSLQDFRALTEPDYTAVKRHILARNRVPEGQLLTAAPRRAAFGLPLVFRYTSLKNAGMRPSSAEFLPAPTGKDRRPPSRQGSPLYLHVLRATDGLHGLFALMDGPVPGTEPPLIEARFPGARLAPTDRSVLEQFLATLR